MLRRSLTLLLLGIGLVACGEFDLCGNDLLATVPSHDGRLKAVVFQRGCGATTGFSTHVSVLTAAEQLLIEGHGFRSTEAGNAFGGEKGTHRPAGWRGGGPWVDVGWQAENVLVVRYDSTAHVFRQEARVTGVELQYVRAGDRR
jgi:hypothetical protein